MRNDENCGEEDLVAWGRWVLEGSLFCHLPHLEWIVALLGRRSEDNKCRDDAQAQGARSCG